VDAAAPSSHPASFLVVGVMYFNFQQAESASLNRLEISDGPIAAEWLAPPAQLQSSQKPPSEQAD